MPNISLDSTLSTSAQVVWVTQMVEVATDCS